MRIALNMATLRGFGSRLVGENLLDELIRSGSNHSFEVWVPASWNRRMNSASSNFIFHNCQKGIASKLWAENVSIRSAITKRRFDCLFSLGDTSLPRCSIPHLLMVQQAYLAYTIYEMDFDLTLAFRFKLRLMEIYFRTALDTISMLTVQTQTMKRRMASRWGISEDRIAVVPSSINIPDRGISWLDTGRRKQYVCFVASPGLHKNHVVLADMMAVLRYRFPAIVCCLTVSSDSLPALVQRAKQLRVLDSFEFLGPLSSKQAIELMVNSAAVVIPSKLESFGICYYEALSLGCPLVVADRDFAREACGDEVKYADADDGAAWAEHVGSLLESSEKRRMASAIAKSRCNQVYRPWTSIVADYLKLLEGLCQI